PAYGGVLNVDHCAICGRQDFKNYSHYSFKYHSVICNRCLDKETLEGAIPVSNKALYFSLYINHLILEVITIIHLYEAVGKALLKFIEMLYEEYSGVYFKSKKLIIK